MAQHISAEEGALRQGAVAVNTAKGNIDTQAHQRAQRDRAACAATGRVRRRRPSPSC
ncbi:hypothetical protein [Demequina litorisediminis]|uniref:hypothetical protein n=1 Tax=Demequina litorisediminis TaxID=1849022 RepID=UPI0024E049A4|nr:hypothetical protein [Demequina litorisediminis]